jgi:hypothetical protein
VIIGVEYDPSWPERFEALRDEHEKAMSAAAVPVVAIEHVGSTSVPAQSGTMTTRSPPPPEAVQASETADSGKTRTGTSTRPSAII